MALESPSADDRRRAVEALAAGREAKADWAVMAFDSIARTDVDPMVRVAALRALRPSAGAATVPLLVNLLRPGDPPEGLRAAPAPVRWEAARLLRDLSRGGSVERGREDEVVGVLLHRADLDDDRNVRITAIEALGSFRQRRVLIALVAALAERDFAVQAAAEASLRTLTGQSHHCDAEEWNRWLARTPDPFAAVADDSAAGHSSWWSRLWERR